MQDNMIAWAAGILEGEGYFGVYSQYGNPLAMIRCRMTDKDVIVRLQEVLKVGRLTWVKGQDTRQDTWCLTIAKQLEVYDTLVKIKPYLLSRRSERVDEIFSLLEVKKKIIERNKNENLLDAG